MADKDNFKNKTIEFCTKYNTDNKILSNYFDSIFLNDTKSMEIYALLLFNDCPKELFNEMKNELKELVKEYMDLQ